MEHIQKKIDQCEDHICMMREDLAANEKYLASLYKELETEHQKKLTELEEQRQKELADLEAERQKQLAELSLNEEFVIHYPVGTKLKWVLNEETYRVAIVTKKGVLQVKSVQDGCGECHDNDCACGPCWEHLHNAPWRPQLPLKKTLFENEAEWRKSLPSSGRVVVTRPHMTDNALKRLCSEPLTADTDAKKLKELESRFSGGIFVLTTSKGQMEIEYFFHNILSRKKEFMGTSFADFGVPAGEKPNLMVEWRGMYIGLSQLF